MDPDLDLALEGGMLSDRADLRWPRPVVAEDGGVKAAAALERPTREAPKRLRSVGCVDCWPEGCLD